MANTVDVSKLNKYIVVSSLPADAIAVTKLNKYIAIGPPSNNLFVSKINKYIVVGLPVVDTAYTFDYEIINQIFAEYIFDYAIITTVTEEYTFDYNIGLSKTFTFDYAIPAPVHYYFEYLEVYGATGGVIESELIFDSATVISGVMPMTVGIITPPDHLILDDLAIPLVFNFYGDFYERIWLDPSIRRLSNPRIGADIPFFLWNAFSFANTLENVTPTDLDGVELDFTYPLAFDRYELKRLNFIITEDAPPTIDGHYFFEFDEGEGTLFIIATVVELFRSLPEIPIVEYWRWNTTMVTAYSSKEQRNSLLAEPRYRSTFEILILDESDRRVRYSQLYNFIARDMKVPFYQYATPLTANAASGATKLFFDPAKTNLRDNEFAALFDPQSEANLIIKVATVDSDGATLETPLDRDVTKRFSIIPCVAMRLPNKSGLRMNSIDGTATLAFESTALRTLLRPDQSASLETFDGFPIMHIRPLANEPVGEDFDQEVEVYDAKYGLPVLYTAWGTPLVGGNRQFIAKRPADMDYWRKFGDTMRGSAVPFLMPTWRGDLTLAIDVALGAVQLFINEFDYAAQWEFATYKRLQIETANGVLWRKVTGINAASLGALPITLDSPIGSEPGDNDIRAISFINVVRIDDDEIKLEHMHRETIVSFDIRNINA